MEHEKMTPDELFKLWQEDGDDFTVFRHEYGGGVVMIKSNDALEALQAGIEVLRQRKKEKGVYQR